MKTLITKQIIKDELDKQIAENKKWIENSGNSKEEMIEIVKSDFFESNDISHNYQNLVDENEAVWAEDMNEDVVQEMRTSAWEEVESLLIDLEVWGLYETNVSDRGWSLVYSSRNKEEVLKEIQRYADIDSEKTTNEDILKELKSAASDECYSFNQTYYRVTNCDDSYI